MLNIKSLTSPLLPEIKFSADHGQCIAIHGASGSGKTLLLRAIADLDPNTADIYLDEQSRSSMPANLWRQRVCYLPAESFWWSDRVDDHFLDQRIQPEQLGLDNAIYDWQVSRLSTGEKQRLALLRALDRNPSVLLLDEITANLDADNTARIETLMKQKLAEGIIIIWVTHDPQQRQRIADSSFTITPSGFRQDDTWN